MVHLEHIKYRYGSETVLDLPAFHAEQGSHHLLLGRSGSGKTTLLHLIAGLHPPTEGRVEVAGQDLSTLSGAALDRFRGRTIGVIFQQLHLLPTLTVAQNLLLAPYLAGLPQEPARVHDVLERLDMGDKASAYPRQLSYGQRQRVAIARAVINRPRVLLADEPTSSLDDQRTEQVLRLLIDQATHEGATLLVATHDARIAEAFPHRLELDTPTPTLVEATP
ncbi:MAG: ABC transporter ATP-binding protein [Bacteroidota bacterium]